MLQIELSRLFRRVLLASGLLLIAAAGPVGSQAREEAPSSALIGGFHEAVLSVADLDNAIEVFLQVAGYQVLHRGQAGPGLAAFWGLDSEQPIDEVVLRNPGTERGYVRLVRFPGLEPPIIRSAAQSWDTGGHFDLNLRAKDVNASFRQLEDRGWTAYNPPIELVFGPFKVSEVLARGPDGVVLAMIERHQPPLEGWPELRRLSRVFNATQIVRDFETSLAFYTQGLGFKVYLEHRGPSQKPGANVLGLPHNLTTEIPRKVAIVSPDGGNDGSVELLSFEGVVGADLADRARPPHRGILTLRFPVSNLEQVMAQVMEHGSSPIAGPSTIPVAPYGNLRAVAISTPEGARLELVESLPGTPETESPSP